MKKAHLGQNSCDRRRCTRGKKSYRGRKGRKGEYSGLNKTEDSRERKIVEHPELDHYHTCWRRAMDALRAAHGVIGFCAVFSRAGFPN